MMSSYSRYLIKHNFSVKRESSLIALRYFVLTNQISFIVITMPYTSKVPSFTHQSISATIL